LQVRVLSPLPAPRDGTRWKKTQELAEKIVFRGLRQYLAEAAAELRKVAWPTRQTVVNLTLIVIAVSIAVGAYIAVLDTVMHAAVEQVL
jgi:preprotein translocase SecE subunit